MSDYLEFYAFPEDMRGMRVLDVGPSTGFFAYEFERRGAEEVVCLELPRWEDHDWTPRYRAGIQAKGAQERERLDRQIMNAPFELVGEALGSSRVRRVWDTIYALDPEVHGQFDIVFSGAMLMHVRDPVLGVQRMRACCRDDGRMIISISHAPDTEGEGPGTARFVGEWDQCNWWQFSPQALKSLLTCCDFGEIQNEAYYVLEDVTKQFSDPTFVCHALPRTSGA